jgi:hypothetical protein
MTHHLMMRGPIDRATNHARTGNEKGPAEQSSRRALPGACDALLYTLNDFRLQRMRIGDEFIRNNPR